MESIAFTIAICTSSKHVNYLNDQSSLTLAQRPLHTELGGELVENYPPAGDIQFERGANAGQRTWYEMK